MLCVDVASIASFSMGGRDGLARAVRPQEREGRGPTAGRHLLAVHGRKLEVAFRADRVKLR